MTIHSEKKLKETLAKNSACYVLITCSQPSGDGNMLVELTYEGDASLASYLLQGAQTIIDNAEDEAGNASAGGKIYHLQ